MKLRLGIACMLVCAGCSSRLDDFSQNEGREPSRDVVMVSAHPSSVFSTAGAKIETARAASLLPQPVTLSSSHSLIGAAPRMSITIVRDVRADATILMPIRPPSVAPARIVSGISGFKPVAAEATPVSTGESQAKFNVLANMKPDIVPRHRAAAVRENSLVSPILHLNLGNDVSTTDVARSRIVNSSLYLSNSQAVPTTQSAANRMISVAAHPNNNAYVYNDFNGDRRSDLTWYCEECITQFSGPGIFGIWSMNSNTVMGTTSAWYHLDYNNGPTGDFNGDGRADILWGIFTGHLYLWMSRSDGAYEERYVANMPDQFTNIVVGDLNADGKDDLILRDSQRMRYWLMDGANVQSVSPLYNVGDRLSFQLVGAGDFDGDHRDDLLWVNGNLGYLYVWRTRQDGEFDPAVFVGGGATFGNPWRILDVKDIDGNGRDDIVWEETPLPSTGNPFRMAYWSMNGATVESVSVFLSPTRARISSVGDFDGDGRNDIVWRNRETAFFPYVFLWRSRSDGNFDELFIGHFDSDWITRK